MKKTLTVVPKVEQFIPESLHVNSFGSGEDTPVITFKKGKRYKATIVSDDTLIATGEDGVEYRVGGNGDGKSYWRDYEFLKNFSMIDPPIVVIETEIYEPNPEKPGWLREVRKKTLGEVYNETCQFLKERDIWDNLDYFHLDRDYSDKEYSKKPFPAWKWIACYAVVGGSEGHYIHVDIITTNGEQKPLFLGKTFLGMEYALHVSNMLTKVFWDEFKGGDKAPR